MSFQMVYSALVESPWEVFLFVVAELLTAVFQHPQLLV
jgi:hypothetical protein